ncbi:FAD-binding oxidoreductase [Microbacterium sp. NPDC077644]|uniref:NAD(P)/FAD-dependent oxidoreductase n=1 Tax=Microbacterium sp. NPDC077644 TaxID=3155055 RepID=UPI0034503FB7
MSGTGSKKVIVIGGGILGASTTAHLARAGADVTLVTQGSLADGASGRSIAWLNSSGDRSSAYHYLRLLAIDRYRTWAARHTDSSAYLRFDGALKWAGPEDSFRRTFEFERSVGYDSLWIDRDDIERLAPGVDAAAIADEGAIFNPGEGWVSLPDIIAVLVAEARDAGATVIENAGEVRVDVHEGTAAGVILGDGSAVAADRVVLATGPAVPAHLVALGVTVPDASPAAFVLFTDPVDFTVKTVLNTPRVAVRPTPDNRLVLDAAWAEESIVVGDDGTIEVPDESIHGLLDEASKVLAGRPTLTASHVGAGWKPIPGDGDPVAGPVPGVDGLYALFTHSGATLGLVLGELAADEVMSGEPSPVLEAFRFERFTDQVLPAKVGTDAWSPVAEG